MPRDARELPPIPWGDRYDLSGVVAGLVIGVVLFLVGAGVWLALALALATVNLLAYTLRRRAGVPQATLWQRVRHRRRRP
jgi:O-antigen/teichoic acid export membrane protein